MMNPNVRPHEKFEQVKKLYEQVTSAKLAENGPWVAWRGKLAECDYTGQAYATYKGIPMASFVFEAEAAKYVNERDATVCPFLHGQPNAKGGYPKTCRGCGAPWEPANEKTTPVTDEQVHYELGKCTGQDLMMLADALGADASDVSNALHRLEKAGRVSKSRRESGLVVWRVR